MRWIVARIVLLLLALPLVAWGGLALWFDGPASRPLAGILAAVLVAVTLVGPLVAGRRGLVTAAVAWVVLFAWWFSIPPRADRDWIPDVAAVPSAEIVGDLLTVRNVRNFLYRSETDYTPQWEERTYDLGQVTGLDIFFSFWGSPLIAHTIMSWDFADGQHLAVSIETRKERGEEYSAVKGFFRQYELYYVVADERDVIGVRASHRGEEVYLYRLAAPPDEARRLLLGYMDSVNKLAARPAWYNAFSHNCTTSIRLNILQAGMTNPWDYRILVNGRAPEMLYERRSINHDLPFAEVRARSDVTARAKAADGDPAFSARIRNGLPPRPNPAERVIAGRG
jgi:hypothetical protein